MDCPELYIQDNGLQRRSAEDALNRFIEKMIWKPNEIVLDLGCGPGDVTSDILFNFLKNKINHLVGVDKSKQMIEYAKNIYGGSNNKIHFKVLDIECANDCKSYLYSFNKLFSFFCFHWIKKKHDALVNMHSMLKSGGEILVHFLLVNPFIELYKCMDTEWQIYVDKASTNVYSSQEDMEAIFVKAGFRIIHIESNTKKYTFPDLSSLLNTLRAVDVMYNILPPDLHDKYSMHLKEKICGRQTVHICSTTGKTTIVYLPITIHAAKE